jgi:hypothetical protein
MADVHDDPLREGANAIVGLASEFSNVIMATQSLQLRLIGLKPDKDAPLEDALEEAAEEIANPHLRAQQQANARFAWQPALNDEWLSDATPIEAARAWAAAVPFAKDEPSAALAMARTEVRLNEVHPEAMAEYRQLRSEGWAPTDAMLECAELFDRPSLSASGPEATASTSLASSRTSARTSLTHDMGLEHSAHLGMDNPISLNLPPGHHSASAGAAYDQTLGASTRATPSAFDDDAAEAGAELDDALVAQVPGTGAENVLQEDINLTASPTAGPTPAQSAEANVAAEGPDLTPQAGANLSPTDIAMRAFPDAHEAAQRTAQLQPAARPQKKKVLQKVLKRGGRR